MTKIYLSLMVVLGMGSIVSAQTTQGADDTFKPSGKPIVTIFSDFTNVNYNGKSNNAFEISRAYFGYGYNFSSDFSGKVLFDVANSATVTVTDPNKTGVTAALPSAYSAFLKNAYGEYSHGLVKVDVGLIGENMFDLQESVWGKRYLYKSFQDQYSFGSSADLGAKVKLQFIPEVSFDFEILNGEGYKKVQADSTFQFAAGLTVQPIKNLFARVYYDYTANQSYATTKVAQSSFNVFVGYKSDGGSIGAEFNTQNGNKFVKGGNWSGYSIYGTLPVINKLSVFARIDALSSDKIGTATTSWNSGKSGSDGQVYIAGVEFVPVKGIQISPNFKYADPSAAVITAGGHATSTINVNLGINF